MTNLVELLAECLEVDDAEISMSLDFKNHSNWDSLAALSLITAIEDEFGFVLGDTDLKKFNSVQDLNDYILINSKK
jgi:acyl carrier protein